MSTTKRNSANSSVRCVHRLCGGAVKLFDPPNPRFVPYLRCTRCGRPVPDYELKKVAIKLQHRRNGQANVKKKRPPSGQAPRHTPHPCHDIR